MSGVVPGLVFLLPSTTTVHDDPHDSPFERRLVHLHVHGVVQEALPKQAESVYFGRGGSFTTLCHIEQAKAKSMPAVGQQFVHAVRRHDDDDGACW